MPATTGRVVWSPSDARLFFAAQGAADTPPGYSDLYVVTLGRRRLRIFQRHYSWLGQWPAVARDRRCGHRRVGERNEGRLRALHVGGGAPATDRDGRRRRRRSRDERSSHRVGVLGAAPTSRRAVRLLEARRRLRRDYRRRPPRTRLARGESEVVHWKSEAARSKDCLYLPPEAAAAKCRSSSTCTAARSARGQSSYSAFTQFLVGHGLGGADAEPAWQQRTRRGVRGREQERLGGGDYRDIMAGVDDVIASEPIDAIEARGVSATATAARWRLHRGKDGSVQGDRVGRAGDRSVQRVRHRRRLVVRPLVFRQAVGAHRGRVAAESSRRRRPREDAVHPAAGRGGHDRSARSVAGDVSRAAPGRASRCSS